MAWSDPIVDEVRQAREAIAARFNYDLGEIIKDARQRAEESGRRIVRRSPRRPASVMKPDHVEGEDHTDE